MKFRAKTKDYHLVIKARAAFRESIDKEELERFAQANIQGFFKPARIKKRRIEYTGIPGMPLFEYLKNPVSKHEFFVITEQLVLAGRHLWERGLSTENLVPDICHVYINKVTKEIQLIYLPVLPNRRQNSFMELMEALVYAVTSSGEDAEYLSRFIYFIRSLGSISIGSIEKLESYIANEDGNAEQILRGRGVDPAYKGLINRQDEAGEDDVTCFEEEVWEENPDEDRTEVVNEERYLLMQDDKSPSLDKRRPDPGIDRQEGQSSNEKKYDHEKEYHREYKKDDRNQDDRNDGIDDDDDRTVMLDEDETGGTDFIVPAQKEISRMPVLYRISTGETIHITKKVFRLGKEEACVDYAVGNNNAVSRSHADIICRENQYFVFDLGSKNKSYINNRALPSQYEVEINNGDILKLANEEFEFRW